MTDHLGYDRRDFAGNNGKRTQILSLTSDRSRSTCREAGRGRLSRRSPKSGSVS
jgi:hypothetical protein